MSAYDMTPCTSPKHPACNIAHDRLKLESTIIRALIRSLKAENWKAISVFTDCHETVRTEKEALDAVFSVDESTVTFERDGKRHGVLLILGNAQDVICDYDFTDGDPDGWNALMDRVTDDLMERYDR
jgi:hypothetical protein